MKKVLASVLSLAMIMSLAGCDSLKSGGSKKGAISEESVISFAEDFGDAVLSQKSKNLKKLCDDFDDDLESVFDEVTNAEGAKGDNKAAYEAIFSTMEYEVDEDSVTLLKKGATVEVVFSVVNFEKVDIDDCSDIDDYLDELGDIKKTKDVTCELELELNDDDELCIANAEDVLEDLYIWEDVDLKFANEVEVTEVVETTEATETEVTEETEVTTEATTEETEATEATTEATEETEATETTTEETKPAVGDPKHSIYKDAVTGVGFDVEGVYEGDKAIYSNTIYMTCVLYVDQDSKLDFESDVICDLYYGGECVDSANVFSSIDESGDRVYKFYTDITFAPDIYDTKHSFLKDGEYTFKFYDPDDIQIAEATCTSKFEDKGYTFEFETGDSKELDTILFFDWYYISKSGIELDFYVEDFDYDYEYSFDLYQGDELIFSSMDYYDEKIVDSGSFVDVYATPDMCDLDEFASGEYTLEVYDTNDALIVSSVFMIP